MGVLDKLGIKTFRTEDEKNQFLRKQPWIYMDITTSFQWKQTLKAPFKGAYPFIVDEKGAHSCIPNTEGIYEYSNRCFDKLKSPGLFGGKKPMEAKLFWVNCEFGNNYIRWNVRAKNRKDDKPLFIAFASVVYSYSFFDAKKLYDFMGKILKKLEPGHLLLDFGDLVDLTFSFMSYTFGDMEDDGYIEFKDHSDGQYFIPTEEEIKTNKKRAFQAQCINEVTSNQLKNNVGLLAANPKDPVVKISR
ncbi:MAG: hypothetical protein J6038_00020 [Bacilli bacterium]|nr:hypothetical protein [Bacilli bacterium]